MGGAPRAWARNCDFFATVELRDDFYRALVNLSAGREWNVAAGARR